MNDLNVVAADDFINTDGNISADASMLQQQGTFTIFSATISADISMLQQE